MTERILLRFVALGDSLTVGFQPPGLYLPGREEFPYTSFLEAIIYRELPRKGLYHLEVSFINLGVPGDTTGRMLQRLQSQVAPLRPDYVIVWGGINDLFSLEEPEEIYYNLRRIYEMALECDIKPIACTLTSVLGYDELIPRIKRLNDLLRRHCRAHRIPMADLFSATADDSGRLRETFSSDGVHLSQAGYMKVANIIYYEALEKILEDCGRGDKCRTTGASLDALDENRSEV